MYVSKSADDYLPNLTAAVDDGHDLVVAIGFLIQPSVVEVATEATDVNFAGVDQFYGEEPDCGGENQSPCALPNVVGLQFPSEEAGYLAGIVAADDVEDRDDLDGRRHQDPAGRTTGSPASGRAPWTRTRTSSS